MTGLSTALTQAGITGITQFGQIPQVDQINAMRSGTKSWSVDTGGAVSSWVQRDAILHALDTKTTYNQTAYPARHPYAAERRHRDMHTRRAGRLSEPLQEALAGRRLKPFRSDHRARRDSGEEGRDDRFTWAGNVGCRRLLSDVSTSADGPEPVSTVHDDLPGWAAATGALQAQLPAKPLQGSPDENETDTGLEEGRHVD